MNEYNTKAFVKWILNDISQNTVKCELGEFLLRQPRLTDVQYIYSFTNAFQW